MDVGKANPGESGRGKSVSLWDIDRLLLGEIKGEEALVLRRKIAESPELQSYLERSQQEAPRRTFADFQRFRKERLENIRAVEERAPPVPATRSIRWREWAERIFFGRPRLAYGMAVALLLGMAVWQFPPGLIATRMDAPAAFSPKGGEGMEILLKVAGGELDPGESAEVVEGDTLAFTYRSSSASHVQIWYREDAGDLLPFAPDTATSKPWSAAMRWSPAPQRILLEGRWSRQEIWVVGSRRALSPAEAKAVVEGGKGVPGGSKAWVFRLKQNNRDAAPSGSGAPGAGS